jgi:hypothetical protein
VREAAAAEGHFQQTGQGRPLLPYGQADRLAFGECAVRVAARCRLDTKVLTSDRIFFNVGARAAAPDIPGVDQVNYLTNSSMIDTDFLPSPAAKRQLHWSGIRSDVGGLAARSVSSRSGRA